MLKSQRLRICCDDNLVHTGIVAETEGVYTDLSLFALLHTASAVYEFCLGANFVEGVCKHFSRAAGSVHLPGVMGLHDLDVRIGEEGGGLLHQTAQHRNAQAHIAGIEHRNFLCRRRSGGILRLFT